MADAKALLAETAGVWAKRRSYSRSQLVIAQALQALELIGRPALTELPGELCGRRQQISRDAGFL